MINIRLINHRSHRMPHTPVFKLKVSVSFWSRDWQQCRLPRVRSVRACGGAVLVRAQDI
jgi:hypothetical protein